ncbi:hypothetical protein AAFF_G00335720 [Aldrovandia affinis]|uniref:Uncharacterized protein n=1 Tax=Aldrovandia affinis TaxID=143900 RepID=A0AAD7SL94_9TELE|nr:hypothetical protein AAFF_G00335720 [Aldrovandia affinis]
MTPGRLSAQSQELALQRLRGDWRTPDGRRAGSYAGRRETRAYAQGTTPQRDRGPARRECQTGAVRFD